MQQNFARMGPNHLAKHNTAALHQYATHGSDTSTGNMTDRSTTHVNSSKVPPGLSFHGHVETDSLQSSSTNELPIWGFKKDQQARFSLPDSGYQALTSVDKTGQKTAVVTAALTSEGAQKATFVRLVSLDKNNQLTGFLNKIYTPDGRVIEMKFKNHGEGPVQANIDLDADGTYANQWVDLKSESGKQTLSKQLGAGLDPNTPNDKVSSGFNSFCESLHFDPSAILYLLGVGPKPQGDAFPGVDPEPPPMDSDDDTVPAASPMDIPSETEDPTPPAESTDDEPVDTHTSNVEIED
jgi:hypothetical protein